MGKNSSILIIDNDADLLKLLKDWFASTQYTCSTAPDGKAALELISKTPFHLMLVDIVMPGMNGLELTEKAKKIRPHMPVIIMTRFIDEFSYDEALEAGASDFIKKPFTFNELMMRIQHVKFQERLRKLAVSDELTGLYNQRGFYALAEQQLNMSDRLKKGIFMLYADLDNLKQINDTLGHQAGDSALKETAEIFKETFRRSDVIARIGGDEFAIMPIGTSRADARISTIRLQRNLQSYNARKNRNYTLSVSGGISYYNPESPCSIDELLIQADRSMYEQKKRNN
jgi:diguanylate cyclase (GGDEF)-like protein